jgi:hypothetical protein
MYTKDQRRAFELKLATQQFYTTRNDIRQLEAFGSPTPGTPVAGRLLNLRVKLERLQGRMAALRLSPVAA